MCDVEQNMYFVFNGNCNLAGCNTLVYVVYSGQFAADFLRPTLELGSDGNTNTLDILAKFVPENLIR